MSNYRLQEIEDISTVSGEPEAKVILFNDDWHTFHEVISQIVKACQYSIERAEQISMIVHFKGRATVITSNLDHCLEIAAVLQEIDLHVEIEPVNADQN